MAYRILVPLDGSTLAEGAIPVAVDLARRSQGALTLVRVHVPVMPISTVGDLAIPFYDPAWDDQLRKVARDYLCVMATKTRHTLGNIVPTVLGDGPDVADAIERAAAECKADLIVMTTHGHGGSALAWLGSVADGVVRTTRRLVLVIPERAAGAPFSVKNVLIAHDGSAFSGSVVAPAAELARLCQASLSLVRVVSPPIVGDVLAAVTTEPQDQFGIDRLAALAKTELDAIAAPLRSRGAKVDTTVIIHTNPARALIDHAKQTGTDLVAMGTHGRGMSRLFVGSVVDKVLRGSGRPSLIRRAEPAEFA